MIRFYDYEKGLIYIYRSIRIERISPHRFKCIGKGNRRNFLERKSIDRRVFKKYSLIIFGIKFINFDNSWWCASEKDARMLLKKQLGELI